MGTDISFKQLEAFCGVIEHRSFSIAAEKLGLRQPTISAHITRLEKQLNTKLLNRTKNQPTEQGRIFYKHASFIVDSVKQMLSAVRLSANNEITIGASNLPGTYLLPELLNAFRNKYPGVKLHLKLSGSDEIIKDVSEGKLEIGVVGIIGTPSHNLAVKYFSADNLVLAVPQKHRWSKLNSVTIQELKQEPFLIREKGSASRKLLMKKLSSKGIGLNDLNIVAELASNDDIKEAVKRGLGVAILPSLAIRNEVKSHSLKILRITGISLSIRIYLIHSKNRPLSSAAGNLVRCINN